MLIGDVIPALRLGKNLRLPEWPAKQYIMLGRTEEGKERIAVVDEAGVINGYTAPSEELLSNNWVVA